MFLGPSDVRERAIVFFRGWSFRLFYCIPESTCWSQIASLRRAQEKREQHDAISFQKRKRAEALYHQELDRLADVKVNVEGLKKVGQRRG